MRLMLTPMEGVVDHTMRELLSSLGGLNRCITEFLRVSDRLLPARVFHRICPELGNDGLTASGVPVYLQILGGDRPGKAGQQSADHRQRRYLEPGRRPALQCGQRL